MFKHANKEPGYTLLELLYVVSIISILACMLIPNLLAQKQRMVELTAQRRLRSIGSVMTDYALSNETRNYADLQDLKDANMIRKDVTAGDLITDYSLIITTRSSGQGNPALFTVIAVPRPERTSGQLSTFAITEDNVIRVYKPGPDVSFNDPHTWEPIL